MLVDIAKYQEKEEINNLETNSIWNKKENRKRGQLK